MAAALLRYKFDRADRSAVVISGGTMGLQGRRAADFARHAIAERDEAMTSTIESHRSQGVSPKLLRRADYLLVMAPKHEEVVRRIAPEATDSIVRLWEHADDGTLDQIPDPVGHDAEVFRGCRDLIEECIDNWLEHTFDDF